MPSLKACLFLRRSKNWRPWTDMRSAASTICSHSPSTSSAKRNQAFLSGKILESIPEIFFFFPEQTLRALRGEATRSPACWAPPFKGSRIHRWVRSGRRFCLLGSEKRNVSGNADRPVLTDSAVPASAAKIGLIKAPLKFTSTEFSLLTRPRWPEQKRLRWTSPVLDLNQQLC